MPIYEYRCVSCNEKSSFFTRSVSARVDPVCQQCGSEDMHRVISPVSFKMSSGTTDRMDYYKDPANIGRNVENSFRRHDVDMPESVRKTIDDARRGKMPKGLDPLVPRNP